jgi:sigma-B regulation protein RsbU (phosphoserine phosphatase)
MTRVNRTLRRRGVEGLFCTLAYALFDFEEGSVTLANSGLPYPLHYRAREKLCSAVEIGGLPLGAFDTAEYDERTLRLEAGDLLVFHTDGVTEARALGQDYGVARLIAQVEAHAGGKAQDVGKRLVADVDDFLGDASPADDVTLVVVRVL